MYFLTLQSCTRASESVQDYVRLPPGFKIQDFAQNIHAARGLALGDQGTIFVGSSESRVYALRDDNSDAKIDRVIVLAQGLNGPHGVAFYRGDLYVAEYGRLLRFRAVEANLKNDFRYEVVTTKLPKDMHHGLKTLRSGPDGLYISIGSPCNVCERSHPFGAIHKINTTTGELKSVAHGIRNSVGFDWDPINKHLWFTDNGRDFLGDDSPPCELNHASKEGMHFGFPYCHGEKISDPEFGKKRACKDFTPVAQPLGPHVAPLGMRFYSGKNFPNEYLNNIFIAEHGSWNRTKKIGYRVSRVTLDKSRKPTGYEPFAEGWLGSNEAVYGRPVDLLILPDGSMLISDDYSGRVYRVTYESQK